MSYDGCMDEMLKKVCKGTPYIPNVGQLKIDYESQEMEAFAGELQKKLSELTEVEGWSTGSLGESDGIELLHYTIAARMKNGKYTTLRVFISKSEPADEREVMLFIDSDVKLNDEVLVAWNDAITYAAEHYKSSIQKFRWTAALTQVGDSEYIGPHGTSKVSIDDLVTFESLPRAYTMRKPTGRAIPNGYNIYSVYPLVIKGVDEGYDWFQLQYSIAEKVNILSSLLSVGWGSTWTLLSSPNRGDNIHLPDGEAMFGPEQLGRTIRQEVEIVSMELPDWIETAYRYVGDNIEAKNALAMYNQGILVEYEHPTLALLAYTASLETIGVLLAKGEGATKKEIQRLRKKERFTKAVTFAVTDEELVKKVVGMYKTRGDSAHEAVLFGDESGYGTSNSSPSIFQMNSANWLFRHMPLADVKSVNRKALVKLFRENHEKK